MTRRRLLALALGIVAHAIIAIGLVCSALIVLSALTGCTITPARYEWYPADAPRMDYYRWEVVERSHMQLLCGPIPAHAEKACVIRLRDAIVKPGDVHLRTGEAAKERGTGPVCLILSTVDEEGAKRIMEQAWEDTLRDHEVIKHCRDGMDHFPMEAK